MADYGTVLTAHSTVPLVTPSLQSLDTTVSMLIVSLHTVGHQTCALHTVQTEYHSNSGTTLRNYDSQL